MNLADAKTQIEALPGVYEVNVFIMRRGPAAVLERVKICIHIASPEILPEQTRLGILGVQDALKRELGCTVSISVSAGLQIPDWAAP